MSVIVPSPRRPPSPHRRSGSIPLRYLRVLVWEFRWTLLILLCAVLLGTILHAITPQQSLDGGRPSPGVSLYAAWMALFAQPLYNPPIAWYLLVVYAVYPVLGFILVGEGVVRLALLMISKRHGEKEWMLVLASTYRDHVVLCGLGHLGFRVLEQLHHTRIPVVVLERSESNSFVVQAKALKVPVLIRDMKEDQALIDAGIREAAAIIICSNDDMSNFEVAIDSRRMNPKIRIVMRLFDQQVASKIAGALTVDAAFSSSALAAPVVAAMSFHTRVLSSLVIGGKTFVAAEVLVEETSSLAGRSISELETLYPLRVLARTSREGATNSAPPGSAAVAAGDTLVIHTAAAELPAIAAAGSRAGR